MRWLICAILLTGCAQQIVWNAPDTPKFKTDDYECTRDATYMPNTIPVPEKSDARFESGGFERGFAKGRNMRGPQLNKDQYVMCMEARGYARNH